MKITILFALLSCISAFRCMNFYGLETPRLGFVCDWAHPPYHYLSILKQTMNIDTIRLPFSREYIESGNFSLMDCFIRDCNSLGLSVILDYHRTYASHQGPSPEEGISLTQFEDTWALVAARYKDHGNVIGIGIFNEYQGKDAEYVIKIHNQVISAIESVVPDKYLYFVGCTNWGGDCGQFRLDKFNIDPERLYIEVHKYIFSGASNPTDWDISIPSSVPSSNWFIGEMGWKSTIPREREWAHTFLSYLHKRNITNVCGWTIAHSGDTDGWWKDDCEVFDWGKAAVLNAFWETRSRRLRGSLDTIPLSG